VPRLYDYHPLAIPAPYNHSNIDADEVLYYVDGDFMSRNDIKQGNISLHPAGIPHGPHPGAAERSIGKERNARVSRNGRYFQTFNGYRRSDENS
jgi:homogentisate 1,2-dioxygenase